MDELKKLEGQKVTLWKMGEMGFGWTKKGRIKAVTFGPYAQHQRVPFISFLPYRSRLTRRIAILPYMRVAIWLGWHDVETDIWDRANATTDENGTTAMRGKASAFSDFWLIQALQSVATKPVFVQDH